MFFVLGAFVFQLQVRCTLLYSLYTISGTRHNARHAAAPRLQAPPTATYAFIHKVTVPPALVTHTRAHTHLCVHSTHIDSSTHTQMYILTARHTHSDRNARTLPCFSQSSWCIFSDIEPFTLPFISFFNPFSDTQSMSRISSSSNSFIIRSNG